MPELIAFRGLQGIGAGFCQAMAFTTISDLYAPAERGRVSGGAATLKCEEDGTPAKPSVPYEARRKPALPELQQAESYVNHWLAYYYDRA